MYATENKNPSPTGYLSRFVSCLGAQLLVFAGLYGCEAPLNLEGVEQQLTKASLRTDQYQEMVENQGVITIVGSQGLILRSQDQGQNWDRQIISGKPNFIGLANCPDASLVALSFNKRIWISTDNGQQWNSLTIPTQEDVMDVHCAPDGSFWVIGSFSTLLNSHDGGASWQQTSLDQDALLTHIEFFDRDNAVVAGEFGLFYKSTDSGNSWEPVGIIGEELYPLALYFRDQKTGWAGGLSGVIMKTTDGGISWSLQQTAVSSPIYKFINDGSDLYATGDHGSILMLQGEQWIQLDSPKTPVYLSTGHMLDNKKLLVAGGSGALFSLPIKAP